jgi:formate hydrogenlyase subunit 3/multisubunit Na+/H+ antiporter MnhD subunit
MAAMLGAGLAVGRTDAAVLVGFYALYHVLTKGGLFLALDALTQTEGQRTRRFVLITAGLAALGFAGLPLTGGAMAKLAIKPLTGDGITGLLFAAAAIGSTLLMLNFIRLIRTITHSPEAATPGGKGREAWLFIFLLAMLLPWLLFDIVTGLATAYAVSPGAILDLGWPTAAGLLIGWALAAAGLMRSGLPASDIRTRGDALIKLWEGIENAVPWSMQRLSAIETASRRWTTSSSLLVLVMLVLTILLGIAGR